MRVNFVLAVIAAMALRVGFLYAAPFGRCPTCKGTGHIKRGPRRGSRTVHRPARRIPHGQQIAARYQREDNRS